MALSLEARLTNIDFEKRETPMQRLVKKSAEFMQQHRGRLSVALPEELADNVVLRIPLVVRRISDGKKSPRISEIEQAMAHAKFDDVLELGEEFGRIECGPEFSIVDNILNSSLKEK